MNKNYKKEEYIKFANDFINFKTPEHVYILGLLWADGHIDKKTNRITFVNITEDFNTIKWIFNKTGNWNICNKEPQKKSWKPITHARVSNLFLSNFLKENDYLIKSGASPDKILSKIPEHLKHYWWLGYFDGDGHISSSRNVVQFSSTIEQNWSFLENLCKYLKMDNIKIYKHINKKNHKSSKVEIYNLDNLTKLYNYMYKDYKNNKIGLNRKYESWKLFIDRNIDYLNELNERESINNFYHMYYNARGKAYKKHTTWDISRKDFANMMTSPCYFCGNNSNQYRKESSFGHSLHRFDDNSNFNTNNCYPVCYRCSLAKSRLNHKEFIEYISRIIDNNNIK